MGIFTAAVALFTNGGVGETEREPRRADAESEAKVKCTVLVIDDDPTILEALRLLLREAGYNVLTSNTGPKGLDMVRYAPRDIRLVLLDYNMPRFNGAETLAFLRKLNPNLKVVALSGFRVTELPANFHAGVDRFISKPFSSADLLKTVGEVLADKSPTKVSIPASA